MSDKIAIYKLIREDIVQDILSGVYEPGDMIYGQQYYSTKFNVSRATVRRAIYELIEKQVLYTVKGKGTYVSKTRTNEARTKRKLSFSQSARSKTHKFTTKVEEIKEIQSDTKTAKQLGINKGDSIICIKRIRFVDEIAENYQISYINKQLVSNIDFSIEDLEQNGLFELLKNKAKLIPKYSDEEIRAVSCPKEVTEKLPLKENDPVLFIRRITYTTDNIVMEYCEDYEYSDIKGLKVRTFA